MQGTGDKFYQDGQLLPENFLKAARDAGYDEVQVRVRSQEGYDHSYYFVSSHARLMMCVTLTVRRCQHLVLIIYTVSLHTLPSPHDATHCDRRTVHANFLKA